MGAVLDRIKDNISLDHLARLLVDVHMDSSKIIDSVISSYQRSLLELIFMGDAESRDKVNLIIANEVTPHLTAEEYMDKGEYENELKQVLGDTRAAFDVSEHDTLICRWTKASMRMSSSRCWATRAQRLMCQSTTR